MYLEVSFVYKFIKNKTNKTIFTEICPKEKNFKVNLFKARRNTTSLRVYYSYFIE